MKLIRGNYNVKPEHRGGYATIGNFDGVHMGHQAVINKLVKLSDSQHQLSTLITFEPLPNEYFLADSAPARLTTLRDKLELLQSLGVNQCLCLPFNKMLASMPADQFVSEVLYKGLGIKLLVVGDDFRFGKNRVGDFTLLKQMSKTLGFDVQSTETFSKESKRVSSTAIRDSLDEGDLKRAATLLGRPFSLSGKVIHGDKRGRELGFPTANISISRKVSPIKGVFAVELNGCGLLNQQGVANIGTRPTIGGNSFLIEAHCLDFSGDLYGKRLEVVIKKKIRKERKFESLDALTQQIAKDKREAQQYFSNQQ